MPQMPRAGALPPELCSLERHIPFMSTPAQAWLIAMHPSDNVAIVANDGGLAAGTILPSTGP